MTATMPRTIYQLQRDLRRVSTPTMETYMADHGDRLDDWEEAIPSVSEKVKALGWGNDEMLLVLVRRECQRADERLRRRAASHQMELLSGEPEAYDGWWALGGRARVRVRKAVGSDWATHLAIEGGVLAAQLAAHSAEMHQYALLSTYLNTDPQMTIPEAGALYAAALAARHPQP
jgi:hypothetical protein